MQIGRKVYLVHSANLRPIPPLCKSLQTLQKIAILRVFSIKHNNLSKQEQKTLNGLLNKRAIDFIKGIIGMP